jgi:glycine oxidase
MLPMLIVGGGLAGTMLALEAHQRNIDFRWMVSPQIPSASMAAYGMCNPVHFRNMVPAWRAPDLYPLAKDFFTRAGFSMQASFVTPMPVHHLVADPVEFIQWRQNTESTLLWKYTSGDRQTDLLPFVNARYSGSVFIQDAFFVDIPALVKQAHVFLADRLFQADFDTKLMEQQGNTWIYQGNTYSSIVFAEGRYGASNPFFSRVPFNVCKGQVLLVNIPGLHITHAIHKKVVLVPVGNEDFICGATYEWDDLTDAPTEGGRTELTSALADILGEKYTFHIKDQKAGVRPTISDRRPVVGWHPKYAGIGILNGLGTRGLLLGPAIVTEFLNNLQQGNSISTEWDVNRFKKRLLK